MMRQNDRTAGYPIVTSKSSRRIRWVPLTRWTLAICLGAAVGTDRGDAATIIVNGEVDGVATTDGICSLREAILNANGNDQSGSPDCVRGSGADVVAFDIPGTGLHSVALSSPLPPITDVLTIDGYSQPGTSPNTLAVGDDAVLAIELNGSGAGAGAIGLMMTKSSGSVRGLVINRFDGAAVVILGAANVTIEGTFIGTDTSGMRALPNRRGIWLRDGASRSTVGGYAPAVRNLISGNLEPAVGIVECSDEDGNVVAGNYVGTDRTGNAAIPNGYGVYVVRSRNSLIGGHEPGAGNVIAGNKGDGIGLWNVTAFEGKRWTAGTRILGNYIGLGADGVTPLGNNGGAFGGGIAIRNYVANTTIGSPAPGAGNVIAFNSPTGVAIFSGTGTTVRGNSIFANTGLGVDLDRTPGRTANDPEDSDRGGNNLQNLAIVIACRLTPRGDLLVDYVVSSSPVHSNYPIAVDFYESDMSRSEQGKTFLGTTRISQPGTGSAILRNAQRLGIAVGDSIVAIATDRNGNSSEFGLPAIAERGGGPS